MTDEAPGPDPKDDATTEGADATPEQAGDTVGTTSPDAAEAAPPPTDETQPISAVPPPPGPSTPTGAEPSGAETTEPSEAGAPVYPPPPATTDADTSGTYYSAAGVAGFGDDDGGDGDDDEPTSKHAAVPPTEEKVGLTGALAPVGAGFAGAGAVVAAVRSESADGIEWSVYGAGLGVVAVLLIASFGAAFLARRGQPQGPRADLITWPGVVGIVALAVLLPIWLNDLDVSGTTIEYVIGAVIVVLGAIGFLLARRAAFAVTVVLGLGVIYARAFDDLFGDSISSDDSAVWVALAVTAFVVLITVFGWLLPSRALTSVTVGVVGVIGIGFSLVMMLVMRLVAGFFSEPGMAGMFSLLVGSGEVDAGGVDLSEIDSWSAVPADYQHDVAIVWALAGGLVLLWALAAVISGHSGFSILAIAMLATAVPLGTAVLAVVHPTWWVVVLGVIGGVVLLAGAPLVRRRARAYA